MEAASNAINSFLTKKGQKDTTVDESVAPAVQHETISRKHEDREQTVIEKEKHQDHYHTTVQPLKDQEVEATEHKHRLAGTQFRDIEHDDAAKTKAQVQAQRGAFQNTTQDGAALETKTQDTTVHGEHVHHHVHETIQPVIEKETIKPSVTHTTIPIKERHHEASENHGVTRNEPMSVDQFKHKLEGETAHSTAAHNGGPNIRH